MSILLITSGSEGLKTTDILILHNYAWFLMTQEEEVLQIQRTGK